MRAAIHWLCHAITTHNIPNSKKLALEAEPRMAAPVDAERVKSVVTRLLGTVEMLESENAKLTQTAARCVMHPILPPIFHPESP